PTRTVGERLDTDIAGVRFSLIPISAETRDLLLVWLPEKDVLIAIGLLYEAFPALTTMRGSRQRDALDYVTSLKLCRGLDPEYLVVLHGPNPVTSGKDNVRQYLTNFSDAIQYLNDQTVQYLNRGYTAEKMMDLIELPPHLASSPYLQETYGLKDWDIIHLFRYYRGYYTGEVRDLFPQSTRSEAEMSAMLAGGVEALALKAAEALGQGSLEWALRLADDALVLEPGHAGAFETKKAAMRALAEETMNSQARNMLLSEYVLMTGQLQSPFPVGDPGAIFARMGDNAVGLMPLDTLHRIMAVSLNAAKSAETDVAAGLTLTDAEGQGPGRYTLNVRRGILEVDPPYDVGEGFALSTDTLTWKQLVLGKLSPADAVAAGKVDITAGAAEDFYAFMGLFD
ncbi:MAG TPA: alkyl sulfatase dimerization domain-containing protein, partial [Candidatus Limnocylindria bacterium]|nr:alkyl sulfatase dimerization domain-containing protein [Candidatus Limnocylindria bacterium]